MKVTKRNLSLGRRIIIILLMVYAIAIIYFMFFAFGRTQLNNPLQEYSFILVPARIPLWFPNDLSLENLLWAFSIGNLLAFVPFGIIIPMIFGTKYYKFLFVFLTTIISLEILQMVTYLGSFDTGDIMINLLGATIGFFSYKIGNKSKLVSQKIIRTILLILSISIACIGCAEILNKMFVA